MQPFPLKIYTEEAIQLIHTQSEFDAFAAAYIKIEAAGGVVLNGKQEVLMIYRKRKWDFPKGKVEENEESPYAAIREVIEETGIEKISITGEFPSTFHTYIENGVPILKQTYWFDMVSWGDAKLTPQKEEDITEVKWVPFEQVADLLTNSYPSLFDMWNMLLL